MRSCHLDKPSYLITNLVYGQTYTKLFLENHLNSLLDETNLPAVAADYDIEYRIYTDQDTLRDLQLHPNMHRLAKCVRITSQLFAWPKEAVKRFNYRYGLLLDMFKGSTDYALKNGFDYCTTWVADLVVAREFFPRILKRMDSGHGAVFVLPLRAASESATPQLMQHGGRALSDKELCAIGLEHMHPLWVASHWNNPQFTRLPFTLIWQGHGGVLVRTMSTTPIIFRPRKEMLETRGMIDGDIPKLCENPYWCTDWTDAPVIGVEPLICYYPTFANRPSSPQLVADFTTSLDPSQVPFLEQRCYYPSKDAVTLRPETLKESDKAIKEIIKLSETNERSA